MLLTELLVPTYRNMLRMLLDLLIKAEATRPGGADGLLSERLVPDMLPLSSQICFAACQAQEAAYRLRGAPIPTEVAALVAEGRAGGSAASSQELARSLLRQALDRLDEIPDDATGSLASRSLTIEVGEGIAFDLTGEQYVRDWALPQFYFHVVTAYALLRSRGLEIGKADYVPHMFQYLRR